MYIIKRDGRKEELNLDKPLLRLKKLSYDLNCSNIDYNEIKNNLCFYINSSITTESIDIILADKVSSLTTIHPDHSILAARILISKLHKETKTLFSEVISDLYENTIFPRSINYKTYKIVMQNADELNSSINYKNDYNYDFFGYKTLERSYLLKQNGKVIERPQHMLMRVSLAIHGDNIPSAIETYKVLCEKCYIHSTPTLLNAGTTNSQLSSCFILTMTEDSIDGIYNTLTKCALIGKSAGGIGLNINCIRAIGCYVAGSNSEANGIVPMLRVFNDTARYVDQGGKKRPGGFAIYLEPWHSEIFGFLDLKRNTGPEQYRARDLFYGLWIPDLFMRRIESDQLWSLMCPKECPGLNECWGHDFEKLYEKYENQKKYNEQIMARTLWEKIIQTQVETGLPFMLYKDSCNSKSNQQNLGTIKCSNLCTEILEFSSENEIAVCNLASIALSKFVDKKNLTFDFQKLKQLTKLITRNLNLIIDANDLPVKEAELSNKKHRPIGIGVQGLADAFILLKQPFNSFKSKELNIKIFETIYFGALEASCELAKEYGCYDSYEGSPVSKGLLQYDMWNKKPTNLWNWDELKKNISKFGVRNSLLVALMPTANTAQILGNNECFEPYTSNIYFRRVMAGDFPIVNKHLVKDLCDLGLWCDKMKLKIISNRGSVQNINEIPENLKDIYKTVWEISQKEILQMAADRAPFIDQSQSLNIHIAEPTMAKISSMHFYGWKLGLKTGMYYLRTKPASYPVPITVDVSSLNICSSCN